MTSDLKRTIMQAGEQMGFREIQFKGTDALVGHYNDLIMAMVLAGVDADEVSMDQERGGDHIIY